MNEIIDREIERLSSELCALVDQEILFLQAREAQLKPQTIDELAILVLRTNPFRVLTRENAIAYTRRNYPIIYISLRGTMTESKFNATLEDAILNSSSLESRINFLNRLKIAELIQLDQTVPLLSIPKEFESLNAFKSNSQTWLQTWSVHEDKSEDELFNALSKEQTKSFPWHYALKTWTDRISTLRPKEARNTLSTSYDIDMKPFEELRSILRV